MKPELERTIQRQWADDEEYVETCRFIELDLNAYWQVEARLRGTASIPPFVIQKLRREWTEVFVVRASGGAEEVVVRREQPLTLDAVKGMSASLVRLADTYGLEWLNWSEFDGCIYRSLHRTPLNWTIEASE
jgi:hypothetical protein